MAGCCNGSIMGSCPFDLGSNPNPATKSLCQKGGMEMGLHSKGDKQKRKARYTEQYKKTAENKQKRILKAEAKKKK